MSATDPLPLCRLHFCVRNKCFKNKVFFCFVLKKSTSVISLQKSHLDMYCFISSLTHKSLYRLSCDFHMCKWALKVRSEKQEMVQVWFNKQLKQMTFSELQHSEGARSHMTGCSAALQSEDPLQKLTAGRLNCPEPLLPLIVFILCPML